MINLTYSSKISNIERLTYGVLLTVMMTFLAGCQTMGGGVPAAEYEIFVPKPAAMRQMNQINVRWEVRNDVAQYCSQTIGLPSQKANSTPPLACAIWQVDTKECLIVTGNRTSHVALGHEIRHCFEGHFH